MLRHNLDLLVDPCLPWLLSTKVYAARHMSDYQPWEVGPALPRLPGRRRGDPRRRPRLGRGALLRDAASPGSSAASGSPAPLMLPVTLGGFLVSPMVMDQFSSRYLAAILLVSPFCLAPAAALLGARRFALALAPYLVSAAVAGWVSYRPFTLAVHPSLAVDERLGAALRERGIRYAVADYWASYRLTFSWRESPVVVPTNQAEDRYRPYRDALRGRARRGVRPRRLPLAREPGGDWRGRSGAARRGSSRRTSGSRSGPSRR